MPTYDYICEACEHEFEEFQSITAPNLKKCPACKKPKLKRLIGIGAGVIFKGSGFYETDYRSDKYKAAAKADSDSSSPKTETAKSESSKTDSAKTESSKPETVKAEAPKAAPAKSETGSKPAAKSESAGKSKKKN